MTKLVGNLLRSYNGNQYQRRALVPRSGDQFGTLDLTWDAANALTSATSIWPNQREFAEYFYDAFQSRIGKRVAQEVLDLATKQAIFRQCKT